MEPDLQLLGQGFQPAPAVDDDTNPESAQSPKYLNGHRLPENLRQKITKDFLGVPLQEIDSYYKKDKTFVVIGLGSRILYRYDGADTYFQNSGGWRSQAITMVSHGIFNYAMMLVVLLNCLLMVYYPLTPPKVTTEPNIANRVLIIKILENAFLLIYLLEFVLRSFARGFFKAQWKHSYMKCIWGWLDVFIIVTGALMAVGITDLYPLVGIRIFKLIPLHPGLLSAWDNVIAKSFKPLRTLLFYLLVILYMLGILGLQLFMGAIGNRCVKQYDSSTTYQSFLDFTRDRANWWTSNDTDSEKLCGHATSSHPCPSNYTCVNTGINPEREYILYDTFFWAELQTIQMLFQDFKESIVEKLWATTGFVAMYFYTLLCFFLGTFSIGAFVYAIIGRELEKEFANKKPETDEYATRSHEPIRVWKLAKLRHTADAVTNHKAFEYFITMVIIVDVVVAGMEKFEMRENSPAFAQTLFVFEKIIGVIYILEFVVKILAVGARVYFKIAQNQFDFAIVLIYVIQSIVDELSTSVRLAPFYQLRALKLVPRWTTLGMVFKVITTSVANTSIHLLAVLGIVLFASAIFGVTNFSKDYYEGSDKLPDATMPRWSLIDFWHSAKLIFRTFCGEWIESLWDIFTVSSDWVVPFVFMITTVLCSNFLITSISVTIMLTTKWVLETGEAKPDTPFEQLFFPITWAWSKISVLIGTEQKCNSDAGNGDVESARNEETPPREASKLQRGLTRIIEHWLFVTITVILLLIVSVSRKAPESFPLFDLIFLVFFLLEIGLRFAAYGCSKRAIGIGLILDVLILLDAFLSLVLSDDRDGVGYIWLRSFRLLMLISRIERITVVGYSLCGQLSVLFKHILAIFYIWFTFALIGIALFSGNFHKCRDDEGNVLDYRVLHRTDIYGNENANYSNQTSKSLCNSNNYTWNPAETNFDNVLEGFWALSQIVTFNGWITPVHSAEDIRGAHAQPHPEASPTSFLYFVGFVIFGVLYPLNILFGVLLTYFRTKGRLQILSTEAQIKAVQTAKDTEAENTVAPRPESLVLQKLFDLVKNEWFQIGICVVIIIDTVLIAVDSPNISESTYTVLLSIHVVVLIVYTAEMILKLCAWRQYYFTKWLNVMDFLVVVLSVLSLLMSDLIEKYVMSPGILRIFRLFHILRLLSIFGIQLQTLKSFRVALQNCFPTLLNIIFFYCTIYISYAVLGNTLFYWGKLPDPDSVNPRLYFHTIESSLITLFLMVTLSGWEGIYEHGIRNQRLDCENPEKCDHTVVGLIYVFSFMAITFLITVNLYLTLGLEIIEQLNVADSKKKKNEGQLRAGNSDHGLATPKNDNETIVLSEITDGFDTRA